MLTLFEVTEFDDRSDPDEAGMFEYIYVGRDYNFTYGENQRIKVRVYGQSSLEKSEWEAYIQEFDGKKVTREMIAKEAIVEVENYFRNLGIMKFFVYSPTRGGYEEI